MHVSNFSSLQKVRNVFIFFISLLDRISFFLFRCVSCVVCRNIPFSLGTFFLCRLESKAVWLSLFSVVGNAQLQKKLCSQLIMSGVSVAG